MHEEPVTVRRIVPGGRDATDVIHGALRGRILSGDIPAGAGLSQAQIAKEHLVSRGPVREAFRLLQREPHVPIALAFRPYPAGSNARPRGGSHAGQRVKLPRRPAAFRRATERAAEFATRPMTRV